MCIIVYKPINENIPKREILRRCFINNNDGGGYMFNNNDDVIIRKGYNDFNEFYKQLKSDVKKYNLKSKSLVLHFRIATSGGLDASKTHPFILTNKSKLINKYNGGVITCNVGVVHNGVLSNYVYGNLSDTQNFIKDFLYDVYYSNLKENIKNKIIKNELNSSKLIILDKTGNVKKYGDFIYDNGVYYSNSSYKEQYYYTSKKYSTYYDTYYDYIIDNFTKITTPQFYCDGYIIDASKNYDYYIDDASGEIYEINKQFKTASFIGNE